MLKQAARPETKRDFELSLRDFRFLADLAYEKTGIVLPEQKRDMVYSRLVRRLRALKLDGFGEYCELLKSNRAEEEMSHLVNAITTNLTGFFREAHHFEHLKGLATEWNASGSRRLRLWSSACSSGMEPYSMAMALRSGIPQIDKWDAKILATDIDSNMVAAGIAGDYSASDVDGIPSYGREHYRVIPAARVQMNPELQKMIAFKELNLLEAWPFKGPFDAIFCRNVVIYFDKPTKERLFDRMADMLAPNGWLYIGHSENLHGITDRFELIGRTIYRRIK